MVFYWASKSAISVEMGCFFLKNPQKGDVFQTSVRTWYTFWSGVVGLGKTLSDCPYAWWHRKLIVTECHACYHRCVSVCMWILHVESVTNHFCKAYIVLPKLLNGRIQTAVQPNTHESNKCRDEMSWSSRGKPTSCQYKKHRWELQRYGRYRGILFHFD